MNKEEIYAQINRLEIELTAPDMTTFREMILQEDIAALRDLLKDTPK